MSKNFLPKKFFKSRGQVVVLYAVVIPVLLMFTGVGLDLGWYYLNVSRLQNAADAAALAGAKTLSEKSDTTFGVHYYTKSLAKKVPQKVELGVLEYEKIEQEKVHLSDLKNYRSAADVKETMIEGRDEVERYARFNVSDITPIQSPSSSTGKISAVDEWINSSNAERKKINGTANLFIERTDLRNDAYGPMYYQVVLSENISHFFLGGWWDPMKATVASVVLLEPHGSDLLSAMLALEDTKVIKNWEIQNYGYNTAHNAPYKEKWNHFQRADKKIYYNDGDVFRTENFEVNAQTGGNGSARKTSANGNKVYEDNELDSINIDYKQDIKMSSTGFTKDWDLGVEELPVSKITSISASEVGWNTNKAFDLRIHSYVDFNAPWPTRYPQSSNPDILWCRIESDPYFWNLGDIGKTMTELNSVRQIFLNFNKSNAGRYPTGSTQGVPGAYKYRPLCIFYMGPEKLEKDDDTKRVSKPLVLNFNTDYNAIIFAPNSPVVINGNGHTFRGFVIAKEFVKATEEDDYKKFESEFTTRDDVYFELEDLDFMFKTGTLPAKSTGVSIDYIDDDVRYYVADITKITEIPYSETVPEDKIQVTFDGSSSQCKYYIDIDSLKYVRKEYELPDEVAVEIDLPDDSKNKLMCYINEEDHFYKRVQTSTISCQDRDIALDYDTSTHGSQKHENVFFFDWKGNLQTKPMEDGSTVPRSDIVGIEDDTLIQNQDVEVVYKLEAFNLSTNSCFTTFGEKTLVRKCYSYLNDGDSVDMFFTTTRAGWID